MRPELVCLDMAGTTVADDGAVERAFEAALDRLGVAPSGAERSRMLEFVRATMGMSKIEVFRSLFGDEERAAAANRAFELSFDELVRREGVRPIPGAREAIERCREAGAAVVLTTGFGAATQGLVLASLGWEGVADLVLCPGEGIRGRPAPDMILTAVLRLGVDDVRAVAVAGDAAADMRSGRAAGATWVVGVRTGADDEARLREGGATDVIDSVASFPDLVFGR